MRRHVVVIAIIVALVVGAIVAVVAVTTPVRRTPIGVLALGAEDAVLFTRYADYADSHAFVELVGADGAARWSDDTTPVRPAEVMGFTAAATAGDAVLVLGADRAHMEWLGALARADGAPRWWVALPGVAAREGGGRLGPMLFTDGARAYVAHEVVDAGGQRSDRLDALAVSDGRLLWSVGRAELGPAHLDVRLVAGATPRLLVAAAGGSEVRELDPERGRPTRIYPVGTVLCASADGLVGLAGSQALWVPFAADAAPVRLGPPDAGLAWNNTCGLRGGDVVLNVARPTGWAMLRIGRADGRVVFDQALGLGPLASEPVVTAPEAALPRFVPHVFCGSDGVPWCELDVVDLDTGRVTAHHKITYAGQITPLFDGDRAWVWLDRVGALVAVDPASGRLGATLGFAGLASAELRADDVAAHHLWLLGVDNAHPGDLPYAVIDLARGALAGVNGAVEAVDASARVQVFLGARPASPAEP